MGRGPYSKIDIFVGRAKSRLASACRNYHLRLRVPAFGIAVALGLVLLFSVFIPTISQVTIPEMIVETDNGQAVVRGITVNLEAVRPVWAIILMALVSLLGPVVPVLADALFQARKDTEAQLPEAVKNEVAEHISQLKRESRISEIKAGEAFRMVSTLPNRVDKERLKEIFRKLDESSS